MSSLVLSTKNEFSKLLMKKKYIVLFIIAIVVCIGRVGGTMLISAISDGRLNIQSNMVMEMLPFMTDILAPLVIFMAVTDLFAVEIQEDTLKTVIMTPITRIKILISKSIAVFIMSAVYFAGYFLMCTILQLISGSGSADVLLASLLSYAVDLIPLLVIIAMAVFINMISKSPTLAMLLCIVFYVLMKYMNYYVSPYGQMLFTAYSRWHRLWIGTALPFTAMISKIGILFGSGLILYTLSYIIFSRKDL